MQDHSVSPVPSTDLQAALPDLPAPAHTVWEDYIWLFSEDQMRAYATLAVQQAQARWREEKLQIMLEWRDANIIRLKAAAYREQEGGPLGAAPFGY